MKRPRVLPSFTLAGLALAAACVTATPANSAEGPTDAQGPVILPAEVLALPVEQAILTAPPHVP
ncbi:MAG: hypothetical protein ABUL61_03485, partial [Oleiharenicola lentus]